MKVPRKAMMSDRAEFQRVRNKGNSRVGRYMILSTLPSEELEQSKFAFITSKKVGKAHERNLVRRRFRHLVSEHGENFSEKRYLVMVGRYSTPGVDFSVLEAEFLKLGKKLGVFNH